MLLNFRIELEQFYNFLYTRKYGSTHWQRCSFVLSPHKIIENVGKQLEFSHNNTTIIRIPSKLTCL